MDELAMTGHAPLDHAGVTRYPTPRVRIVFES
jgi:hypothetical protein